MTTPTAEQAREAEDHLDFASKLLFVSQVADPANVAACIEQAKQHLEAAAAALGFKLVKE